MSAVLTRIDTHRHLGGCIPPWWVWQTISENGWSYIAESFEEVKSYMTFSTGEAYGFHRFLDKFKILDHIKWNEDLIDRSIKAVCSDIIAEGIDYCWMDFSINKYMENMDWHKKEAISFIHDRFNHYMPGKIGLILSLKYESTHASQRQYAKLIDDPDVVEMLFGIDLVGDELYFDCEFYKPIFMQWSSAGKMTRAHVSESQDYVNCYRAIKDLKVSNIAHGINIYTNDEIMAYAKDAGVTFDLGLTSNYMTGVWTNDRRHPIMKMVDYGLKVTLGTDDPIQCATTLQDEYNLANDMGVTQDQIESMRITASNNTAAHI